ncbi:hypothetical protein [Streptomyces olivoreticuli]|uniref:hypothetical protein n=1 Tax=Streptomyces olivoreticuli TaxID=68246 RepID=UPI000E22580F|nr:hypothetical protein [Streptomyces olivoreticuli]
MPNPRLLLLRGGTVISMDGPDGVLPVGDWGAMHRSGIRAGGTALVLGGGADRVLDPMSLLLSEGSYTAGNAYGESVYPAVIAALGHGSLGPEKMITKRVALDDAVKEAFGALLDPAGAAHQVKVLVHP